MKNPAIPDGVWPTMLTPFKPEDESVDYAALEKLVNWYIERGVHGLFAVCQSSEMFFLTTEERLEVTRFVIKAAAGRVPVIASGHVADDIDTQIRDINNMAETGVEAVVLLPNRLAKREESSDVFRANLETILEKADKSIVFGLYECPYPYKRVLTPADAAFAADTGRFGFLKDTCCNFAEISEKLRLTAGKGFKIFNANCAQLLDTLRIGVSGFSGIMANFHPDLYVWLFENYKAQPERAQRLQNFLGVSSAIESRNYPVCAKKYISRFEIPGFPEFTRVRKGESFLDAFNWEVSQMFGLNQEYRRDYGLLK